VPRPAWATFFDDEEWAAFLETVHEELARLGLNGEVDEHGTLTFPGEQGQYGLANLAQTCHGLPRAEWPEAAAGHFRQLIATHARDTESLAFAEASPLLKLRIWAAADMPPAARVVARELADDLLLVLSLDLPESVATVTPEQVEEWGRDEDELFAIAGEQTRSAEEVEVERIELTGGVELVCTVGDSFFAASQILWPGRLLGDAMREHGALVAAPNRHLGIALAIDGLRVMDAFATLVSFLAGRYDEGPGSISPHLYWVREGETLLRIPVAMSEDGAQVFPPDEFVALLNRLAEDDR
jgi:hypothetical protein